MFCRKSADKINSRLESVSDRVQNEELERESEEMHRKEEEIEEQDEEEQDSSMNSSSSCNASGISSSQAPPQSGAHRKKRKDNRCDACGAKPAVWYCPADDAYLCCSCDKSVHSANAFSLRHERVSLEEEEQAETDAKEPPDQEVAQEHDRSVSSRKDLIDSCKRTRCCETICKSNKMIKLESKSTDEDSPESGLADLRDEHEQEEDHLEDIDRFLNSDGIEEHEEQEEKHLIVAPAIATCEDLNEFLGLSGFESEEDDEERFDFAIRNENPRFCSLIDGRDGVGFHAGNHTHGGDMNRFCPGRVKREEQEDFLGPCREGIVGQILGLKCEGGSGFERDFQQMHLQHLQRRICLRLDYEDVLNAWSDRRPFLTGDSTTSALPDDSISDAAGSSDVGVVPDLSRESKSKSVEEQAGQVPVVHVEQLDGAGREARVTRYREKRRTRLFSKKIRYEVRKLNAERRPRLKGRFVKRSPNGDN